MSKLKEYSWITKDKLMSYTLVALVILAIFTAVLWWPITQKGWSLGLTLIVNCAIAVVVSVVLDGLLAFVMKVKGPLNTMSAAVFGMIVALSYSLGMPAMAMVEVLPLVAPEAFTYVAVISAVGMIVFKKLQNLLGRKYLNPAATAKLLVLLPFLHQVLLPADHSSIPTLAAPLGYEGLASFASYLQSCLANPVALTEGAITLPPSPSELFWTLFVCKYHGCLVALQA
jgi:hypothetical protein